MKAILNLLLGLLAVVSIAGISDIRHSENALKPPKIERETAVREEIVTGVCNFGDCPVATLPATEMSFANTTEPETEVATKVVAENATTETEAEPEETETETETLTAEETEAVAEPTEKNGYIGTFWITGYTAEEGFHEGSGTASGYGVRPGYCAMNADQRRSLGISYGDQIYVEGLGTYTVMDCGCGWGVVDIWVYTNAEAYSITGSRAVYYG